MRTVCLLVVCVAAWGCTPNIPDGIFACTTDADCPDGLQCAADELCRRTGAADLPGDAGGGNNPDGGGATPDDGSQPPSGNDPDADGGEDDGGAVGDGAVGPVDGGDNSPVDGGDAGDPGMQPDADTMSCPASHVCVPPVPLGWSGPVALGEGTSRPDCSGAYPDSVATGGSGARFTPADCDCDCGDPSGVQCGSTVTVTYYSSTSCLPAVGGNQTQPFISGSCVPANEPASTEAVRVSASVVSATGECAPIDNHRLDPPSWDTEMRVCGGATLADGCDGDQLCAPLPPAGLGTTLCIWRDVQAACPAGYTALNPYHTDLQEGRSCSDCRCGDPTGVTCRASATLYSGNCPDPGDIVTIPPPVVQNGQCLRRDTGIGNISARSLGPEGGQCSSSGGQPQGTVEPIDPLTVCCI